MGDHKSLKPQTPKFTNFRSPTCTGRYHDKQETNMTWLCYNTEEID